MSTIDWYDDEASPEASAETCPLCSASLASAPVVGTVARGGKPSRRVSCVTCGLVQVSPRPSPEMLAEYYRGTYWSEHPPTTLRVTIGDEVRFVEPGSAEYDDAIAIMHRTRAVAVLDAVGEGASVIEVGCGEGLTLEHMQAVGLDVRGLEPDAGQAARARERVGADRVTIGTLAATMTGNLDAAVSFHMLEHHLDPVAALRAMARLVRPGGAVFVEVPDTQAPSLPLTEHWQWAHLYDFTPDTLAACFEAAGIAAHIDARGGNLRCWGRVRSGAWAPQEPLAGLASGEDMAAWLRALEGQREPVPASDGRSVLERFLEGTPVAELGPDAERAMRREIADWRGEVNRLAEAWDQACDLVGAMSERCDEEGGVRVEAWHPDEWIHGFTVGEGHAWLRARTLFGTVANALRMREIADGRRSDG